MEFRVVIGAFMLASVTMVTACGGGGDSSSNSSSSSSSSSSSVTSSSSSSSSSSANSASGPGIYTLGGTVSGLSATGLVLQANGGTAFVTLNSGAASFAFPNFLLPTGGAYAVVVAVQPAGLTCTVANGFGTATANVSNVVVTCAAAVPYTVGGTVIGLSGTGLELQLNGSNDLAITGTPFTFTAPLSGQGYTVGIKTQPASQTCTVSNARGGVSAANVTNVLVTCTNNVTSPLSGTYQITTSGFTGRAVMTFFPDGTYIFGLHSNDATCTANSGNGVEYGVYNWNQATHTFSIRTVAIDTNGDCGLANGSRYWTGTIVKNNDGSLSMDFLDTDGSGTHILLTGSPVPSTTGSLIGSWKSGPNQAFTVFFSDNTFFAAYAFHFNGGLGSAGIESGCYAFNPGATFASGSMTLSRACMINGSTSAADTNGGFGLPADTANTYFAVIGAGDTLQVQPGAPPSGTGGLLRITAN